MAGAPSVTRDNLPVTKQLFPCQTVHFFRTLLGLALNGLFASIQPADEVFGTRR